MWRNTLTLTAITALLIAVPKLHAQDLEDNTAPIDMQMATSTDAEAAGTLSGESTPSTDIGNAVDDAMKPEVHKAKNKATHVAGKSAKKKKAAKKPKRAAASVKKSPKKKAGGKSKKKASKGKKPKKKKGHGG